MMRGKGKSLKEKKNCKKKVNKDSHEKFKWNQITMTEIWPWWLCVLIHTLMFLDSRSIIYYRAPTTKHNFLMSALLPYINQCSSNGIKIQYKEEGFSITCSSAREITDATWKKDCLIWSLLVLCLSRSLDIYVACVIVNLVLVTHAISQKSIKSRALFFLSF